MSLRIQRSPRRMPMACRSMASCCCPGLALGFTAITYSLHRVRTGALPMVATAYPRKFVPADFDPSDLGHINTLYGALQHRALRSTAELERWLDDVSELSAVLDEFGARRYIDKSCHTD